MIESSQIGIYEFAVTRMAYDPHGRDHVRESFLLPSRPLRGQTQVGWWVEPKIVV